MEIEEYLLPNKEKMPEWLEKFTPGERLDAAKIIASSRVLYYPGALYDGQPIRTFNRAQYAHVFIYADYGVERENYLRELERRGCKGYHILETRELTERELAPNGWRRHVMPDERQTSWVKGWMKQPFGTITIFERDDDYDESHGSKRFALIYLCADGIATYDALFGNGYCKSFILLLQDHGFGGNYDKFGRGGLMNRIADITGAYPEMMLCEQEDNVWEGYEKAEGVEPTVGGMHLNRRALFLKRQ